MTLTFNNGFMSQECIFTWTRPITNKRPHNLGNIIPLWYEDEQFIFEGTCVVSHIEYMLGDKPLEDFWLIKAESVGEPDRFQMKPPID